MAQSSHGYDVLLGTGWRPGEEYFMVQGDAGCFEDEMKIAKTMVSTVLALAALAAFGWYFLSSLGSGRTDELAAVLVSAPPGYSVVELGEADPAAAAAELEALVARPGAGKVGVRFERRGAAVFWLADVGGDVLEERSAGASGTRLQTEWRGGLRRRLAWARVHGDFDAPGLPLPESRNLYH
jgi:hypothetical protein